MQCHTPPRPCAAALEYQRVPSSTNGHKHNLLRLVGTTRHHGFPVLDDDGRLAGVVRWKDAQSVPDGDRDATAVAEIMTSPAITVTADDHERRALDLIERHGIGRTIVVRSEDPGVVVGVVTKEDLIKAYAGIAPSD